MEKKTGVESRQPVEVILIVPLGVEEVIFKWGIHSVKDYLGNTCDSSTTNIQVWDFSSDRYFAELHKRYSKTLSKIFLSLKIEQMSAVFGTTSNPDIFLGLAACTGEDFLRLAGLSRWFRGSSARDLRTLQSEVNKHIAGEIEEFTKANRDANRIWAFSVYDRTLFNSLYIARLVKETDPTASVIFGGDYFNFQAAEETFKNVSFVDGIVAGYGEEVMKKIVLEQQQGNSIRNLRIQGLVNDSYIQAQGESPSLEAVNIPPFYKDLPTKPVISYVQQNEANEIRILAQRGCSWGKCVFCAQLDKEMYFQISAEHLMKRIQTEIEAAKSSGEKIPIKISFDSDENSMDMIIRFIKYLDSMDVPGVRFEISLWYQVKSYRKELVEALAGIDNKKTHVHFMFNFESLNADTLRNMRKGHSPLQAIEGAKAIQDCGHSYVTNYFMHYPLEDSKSIAHETEMLKRVTHLLIPPKGGGIFAYYGSNNRDSIYQNQEKYKVKIRRLKGDTWLKDVFGIDLPYSMWAYTYDEKPSFALDRLLIWSYFNTIKARDAVYRPRRTVEANWEEAKIPFRETTAIFSRSLKSFIWKSLHYFLTLIGRGKAFRHRTQFAMYLSKILEAGAAKPDSEESSERTWKLNLRMATRKAKVRQSHFYLQDDRLEKEYNGPGKKEKWAMPLSSNEFKILRYLYWSRKRKQVMEAFKEEMDEQEINKIIDRHIELGTVVQFRDLLLCVVNDPGYWK
jgi:hypothetical protein